mmetsp:Transcript_20520/g.47973  ORF Transcript_20520/g.47973 Transcript_20520/m.47973 type:complete len:209 (+) Transcript_20520:152-778(+)
MEEGGLGPTLLLLGVEEEDAVDEIGEVEGLGDDVSHPHHEVALPVCLYSVGCHTDDGHRKTSLAKLLSCEVAGEIWHDHVHKDNVIHTLATLLDTLQPVLCLLNRGSLLDQLTGEEPAEQRRVVHNKNEIPVQAPGRGVLCLHLHIVAGSTWRVRSWCSHSWLLRGSGALGALSRPGGRRPRPASHASDIRGTQPDISRIDFGQWAEL